MTEEEAKTKWCPMAGRRQPMNNIEMHKRLQGLYNWSPQEGDRVALADGLTGFITKIKDKKDGGYVYVRWSDGIESCDKPDCIKDYFAWLPLPIDPVNPERGLLGMINRFDVMYKFESDKWYIETDFHEAGKGIEALDPETALLKALCNQEGV